jgi:ATP-binding cassette subfamily F protein uup
VGSTIAFEGNGRVAEYVGGYDDWLRQRPVEKADTPAEPAAAKQSPSKPQSSSKKLSYKFQRELEQLPAKIEELESKLEALQESMAAPEFYQQDANTIAVKGNKLKELQQELEEAYGRWEELEEMS